MHSELPEIERHVCELEALTDHHDTSAAVQPSSLLSWWGCRTEQTPLLVMLHRGDEAVAAAALALRRRVGVNWVSRAGVDGEPYTFLGAATDRQLLAQRLPAILPRPWRLRLSDLRDEAVLQTLVLAPELRTYALGPLIAAHDVGPGADPTVSLDWDTRTARRRTLDRLEREGRRLTVEWHRGVRGLATVLAELLTWHCPSDRTPFDGTMFDRSLFEQTLHGHAAAGRLDLLQVRVDGELVAFAAGVRTGTTLWLYAEGSHPSWSGHQLDQLLEAETVRHATDDPAVRTLERRCESPADRRATLLLSHEVTLASGPAVARLAAVRRQLSR